jgi:preprotein translocase subunit SecF
MMLVGLSLDTDMMLTIKTVKRKEGTPRERAYDAFKTGFAMTSTVIVAFVVLLALGMITHIPTYYQIGAVAVAGLFGDLIATWMLNAVLVLWFLEGKYGKFLHMIKR